MTSSTVPFDACSIGTCEGKFLVMALTAMGVHRMVLFLSDKTTSLAFKLQKTQDDTTVVPNTLNTGFVGLSMRD